MREKTEESPIERKIAGLLQRIKSFRPIEVSPQESFYEYAVREFVNHKCHDSLCYREGPKYKGGRFVGRGWLFCCSQGHEERCNCAGKKLVRDLFEKYRLDFLVISGGRRFCIECDGREWHVDKEKDAERDKWLLAKGIPTLRLPGEYIHVATDRALLDKLTNFFFGQKLGQKIQECEATKKANQSLLTPNGGLRKW